MRRLILFFLIKNTRIACTPIGRSKEERKKQRSIVILVIGRPVFIKENVLKIFILWKIINNIYIYIYFIYFSSILNINEKNICYMLRFTQYFIQTFLLNPLCKWIKKLLLDKKKKKKSARYQNLVTNVFLSIVTISTSLKK